MNRFSWLLAWRYVRRHPRRRRVAFSTVVSMAGVAVGVGALVVVMGVLSGLEGFIGESILTVDAPLTVLPDSGGSLEADSSLLASLAGVAGVEAVSPYIQGEAVLQLPSRGLDAGCVVRGIDPERDLADDWMAEHLSYGSPALRAGGGDGIVLGLYLAERVQHAVGDTLLVFPPKAFFSSRGYAIGRAVFTAAVETGSPPNDETMAWVHIDLARSMFLPGGGYSGISIREGPGVDIRRLERDLAPLIPEGASVMTWRELNPDLTASIKLERLGAFLAILLIILVATFNIVGTISRSAMERRRDVSVLKAMGATHGLVFRVFLWEGVLVGLSGVLLGVALGLAGCWFIGESGAISLPDVYSFHESIPVDIHGPDVALVAAAALLLSVAAACAPALRAASISPVEGLRQ